CRRPAPRCGLWAVAAGTAPCCAAVGRAAPRAGTGPEETAGDRAGDRPALGMGCGSCGRSPLAIMKAGGARRWNRRYSWPRAVQPRWPPSARWRAVAPVGVEHARRVLADVDI